jgi:hypothetical protein
VGIFESRPARASRLVMIVAGAVACGGHGSPADTVPGPTAARTVELASVYLLQRSGTPPPDTTVTITAGTPRHILFRTARPDNAVLADVYFGAQAFAAPAGTEVAVTLRANPDAFGLVLESASAFQAGGEITFKYAVHFQAPPETTAKYPNHVLLERALAVGRLGANGQIDLLPSTRPAADNLQAPAATPGTYVVAAPR